MKTLFIVKCSINVHHYEVVVFLCKVVSLLEVLGYMDCK